MSNNLKKFLFIVERNIYYKFYGPIIDELIKRGQEVHLIHRCDSEKFDLKNQKMFYYPFLSQVPQFEKRVDNLSIFKDNHEIESYINNENIDYVISLLSRGHYGLTKNNEEWCCIQHGIDSFKEVNFDCEYFFIYTKNWINDRLFKYSSKTKIVETGIYYCDDHDKTKICQKYNLSPEKKYIFFTPLPVNTGNSYTFVKGRVQRELMNRYLLRKEKEVLKQLSKKAKSLNYEIIIKSRFKRFLTKEYSTFGHVFYDDSFYPSSVNELVSISEKVVVNYMPGAMVTEGSYYNKDFILINYPKYSESVFRHVNNYIENLFLPDLSEDCIINIEDTSKLVKRVFSKNTNNTKDYRKKYVEGPGVKTVVDTLL